MHIEVMMRSGQRQFREAFEARGYAPDYDRSLSDPANITTGISAEDEWW